MTKVLSHLMALSAVAFAMAPPAAAQTLQAAVPVTAAGRARPTPEIAMFAGGSVRDVAGGRESAANVSGSLGLRYRGAAFLVTGLVNVASTEDTIRTGFGETLLSPASGRALNAGLLDIRAPRLPLQSLNERCRDHPDAVLCHVGAHAYLSASSARWATALQDDGRVLSSDIVPTWGMGIGLSYTFFNGMLVDSTQAGMILDVGLATRHLRGDLLGDPDTRAAILDTDETNFLGLEVGLNLQYNTLNGGLTYYYMGGDLDGFSKGQVVAGFSIQADLNVSRIAR